MTHSKGKTVRTYDILNAGPRNRFMADGRIVSNSGRLIQPQNLPRTYIDGDLLPLARDLVKQQDAAGLRLVYGANVADTLSQLIRTALCASPGALLVDADFSAIEARLIAWLAGEEWVLDVFRTHGKIYEAAAAQMFGVPLDRIKKGNPEYAYRQKGKVATLALGYQGGTNALVNMGALRMGIPEADLPDIVDRWRQANSKIVQFWWDLDAASKHTVQTGRTSTLQGGRLVLAREMDRANGLDFLTIRLPSGRKLYYARPHMGKDRFGRPSICYMGVNQITRKWDRIETYGGKLAENCLCGDTLVLTPNGWKRMDLLTMRDAVWDGRQWVQHDGVIRKGTRPVIDVDGVRMTPDHKIYTGSGWKCASSSERYYRYAVELPDSRLIRWLGRKEVTVANPVRLWERKCGPRRADKYVVHQTGCHEQVYDLRNCGPNRRFTVMGKAGPMLVHNCTQAVARDCLAEAITRLEAHGYRVVFHIHDEVVVDRPGATEADLDRVTEIMSEVPDWAEGLPLAADGWVNAFFKKD